MATVQELIELMRTGGDSVPETIYDDISAAYAAETQGFASSVSDHDSALAAKDAEISRLKAANYDLLISSGVEVPGSEKSEEPGDNGGEASEGEETPIESLFGENADEDDEDEKE